MPKRMGKKEMMGEYCECNGGWCICRTIFGGLLFLLGLAWLGTSLKWWALDWPFWPVIIALTGVWILGRNFCQHCCGCCH